MGDPCTACSHAFDNHSCEKCDDFGDWAPCRQLATAIEKIRAADRERYAKCCDESAEYWERMERAADTERSAYAFALAAECLRRQARKIRGAKC